MWLHFFTSWLGKSTLVLEYCLLSIFLLYPPLVDIQQTLAVAWGRAEGNLHTQSASCSHAERLTHCCSLWVSACPIPHLQPGVGIAKLLPSSLESNWQENILNAYTLTISEMKFILYTVYIDIVLFCTWFVCILFIFLPGLNYPNVCYNTPQNLLQMVFTSWLRCSCILHWTVMSMVPKRCTATFSRCVYFRHLDWIM